jgi:hypothetical protein
MCAFISLRILTEKIGFSSQIYFFIACVIAVYADVGIKKLFFFSEKPSFKDFFLPAPWKAYVISFLFLLICVGPLFSAYIYFLIALLSGNLISLPFLPYSIYVILGMLGVWGVYVYFGRYFMTLMTFFEIKEGIIPAYKKAGNMMRGNRITIIALQIISILLLAGSFWIIPIAGFVATPLIFGIWIYVYQSLRNSE